MNSFVNKLGLKKNKEDTSPASTIAKLRDIEAMFLKKQEHLEHKIKVELETARANGKTNKRVAIQALKRKKKYEQQLLQIDGTMATIEMQREALESATTNTKILSTMKQAADALKQAHHKMNVDDVHDIIDDIADQQILAKEVADAISSPVGFDNDVAEEELLKELDELEQKELDAKLLDINAGAPVLPSVVDVPLPSTSGQAASKESEDQLKLLEEWAS